MEFSSGGWPVWQGQFGPFGEELDTQPASTKYKYAGLERDTETNVDHAQFRQLDYLQGRWMSADPYDGSMDLNDPQSLNRYSYVMNDPLDYSDPSGLDRTCIANCSKQTSGPEKRKEDPDEDNEYPAYDPRGWIGLRRHPKFNESHGDRPTNKASSSVCSAPVAPSGVSINTDIKFANILHVFSVSNLPIFYQLVRNKGPMDYKQRALSLSDTGRLGPSPYADFGNFNYGAIGAALGIPHNLLLRAAGYAQRQAGTSTPEWGNWKGGPPYGDDPNDQAQINAGYNYYQSECYKKT